MRSRYHVACEVHAEGLGLVRRYRRAARFDVEALAHAREQLVRRQAVRVAHDAVVVEDAHLVVRERDDEKRFVARIGAAPLPRRWRATRAAAAARWWPSAMYSASSAFSAVENCSTRAASSTHQTLCITSFGPSARSVGAPAAASCSSARNAALARYAHSTGPVCAFSASMLRTRSFSLSGRVSSCLRMRLASYAAMEPTQATPVCSRPCARHAIDVVRRLAVRARAPSRAAPRNSAAPRA